MDEEFLMEAFLYHQALFSDLNDRNFDQCNKEELLGKMEFVFEKCYGFNYRENDKHLKKAEKILEKFLSVSKVDEETCWKFNVSFIYSLLNNKSKCVNFLLWTISENDVKCIIDENCREYKSFDDFLNNNVLPKCFMTFPKDGIYKGKLYGQLDCAWSVACRTGTVVRNVLDVVAPVGAVAAVAVSCATPLVTIPLVGFMATSSYSIFRNVEKLSDINNHEGGLSLKNKNTVIAGLDLTCTAAGILTFGASAAIRSFASFTGKAISEGSMILRVLTVLGRSFQITCGAGAVVFIVICIEKYKEGTLTKQDVITMAKYLLFSLNSFISPATLQNIIEYLARFSLKAVFENNNLLTKKTYLEIKKVVQYIRPSEWLRFIIDFFPSLTPAAKLVPEIVQVKKAASDVVSVTRSMLNDGSSTEDIYKLLFCLNQLYCVVRQTLENKKNELAKLFGVENWDKLCKWSGAWCSNVEKKLLIAEHLKTNIENCIATVSQDDVKDVFYSFIFSIIHDENMKDDTEALQRTIFYCRTIIEEVNTELTAHVYENLKSNADIVYNKKKSSKAVMDGENLLSKCFNHVISNFFEKLDVYEKQFTENKQMEVESTSERVPDDPLYFDWPLNEDFSKNTLYEIANTMIELKVDENNSVYNTYLENLSIIYMKQQKSVLVFFHEFVNKTHLKGVMLHISGS